MSWPNPSTKRERLLARVADVEDKLERLVADLPGQLVGDADDALRHVRELREELQRPGALRK
jgi:hypothetical protein